MDKGKASKPWETALCKWCHVSSILAAEVAQFLGEAGLGGWSRADGRHCVRFPNLACTPQQNKEHTEQILEPLVSWSYFCYLLVSCISVVEPRHQSLHFWTWKIPHPVFKHVECFRALIHTLILSNWWRIRGFCLWHRYHRPPSFPLQSIVWMVWLFYDVLFYCHQSVPIDSALPSDIDS